MTVTSTHRRSCLRSRWAVGSLVVGLLIAACSAAEQPQNSTPAEHVDLTAALPASACGDDQPGRYLAEIFALQPVVTRQFAGGLLADIYQPADDPASCRVGVIWVHGGGFTQFDRTGTAEQAWGTALAMRGYLAMVIDYRLGEGDPFSLDMAADPSRAEVVSNAIEDAQSAVRWLRAGGEFRVDPGRIAIGGTSAGAMAAAGAALTASTEDSACTLVSVSGDIEERWVTGTQTSALFVHGDADTVVPYESSVSAVDWINQSGGNAQLITISGAGHEITGVPPPELVQEATGWLREHAAARCG